MLGEVCGHAPLIVLEFVADREIKEPFPSSACTCTSTPTGHGLICYPMSGNVDGAKGDTVIFAPPYNATYDELEDIVEKLDRSVREAAQEIQR